MNATASNSQIVSTVAGQDDKCPECSLPEAVHCTKCGWCPRESDGGCECNPVMASAED